MFLMSCLFISTPAYYLLSNTVISYHDEHMVFSFSIITENTV